MVEKISGEYNTYPTDVAERAWGGWLTRVNCPHIVTPYNINARRFHITLAA